MDPTLTSTKTSLIIIFYEQLLNLHHSCSLRVPLHGDSIIEEELMLKFKKKVNQHCPPSNLLCTHSGPDPP